MEKLDEIDKRILCELQNDSRLTTKELAAMVNLTTTPVYERVKRLEKEGYIKKYVAVLDPEKVDMGFVVYVNVKLSRQSRQGAGEFMGLVRNIPEVTECYSVAGSYDYMLKVHSPNMRYYRQFVLDVLGANECIGNIESVFVMSEVKSTHAIPIVGAIEDN